MSTVSFLEPLFLWGGLFAGAVLILHLLRRPRTVKLAFSTLRFFSTSAVAANRSRKLRRWLLLLVRLLIVFLIVIIFARPYNATDPLYPLVDPSADLLIWIDQTPSMSYSETGGSLLEQAVAFIDSLAVLRGGGRGMAMYQADEDVFVSYEAFKTAPPKIRHTTTFASFGAACEEKLSDARHPVVLLLSDFQTMTTDELRGLPTLRNNRMRAVAAVPFTPESPWNLAVQKAHADGIAGVDVTIAAFGHAGGSGKLQVAAETVRSPFIPCSLSTGGDTTITVSFGTTGRQTWGTVSFRGDDPLSFDNTGYFTMDRGGGYSVLIIGDPTVNFPIATALRAADTAYWATVSRKTAEQVTFEECASADLVIVNGCRSPLPQLEALRDKRGGSGRQAFIIAGGNDTLFDRAWQQFGQVFAPEGKTAHKRSAVSVRLPDTTSGIWRAFPALLCTEVHVYRYYSGLTGTVLLHLSNGATLAAGNVDGLGRRWVVCATPLGVTESNNLCETGFYVPFIDRICRYACAELAARDKRWVAGTVLRNPWFGSASPAQLYSVRDGRLLLRLQQQQRFTITQPGMYKIVPPGAQPYFKAVLPDTLESRCDYHLPDKKTPGCETWETVPPEMLLAYIKEHRRTAWQVLPWVLLSIFLISEVLLRERRKPSVV